MEINETYRLAGIGTRFFAVVIDGFIIGFIGSIFGANGEWILGGLIGFLLNLGYHWFFLTRNNGQTPGKMFLNIRVIKTDGSPIGDLDAILRYFGYLVNTAVLGLGWLWAFIDPQRQGWHDKMAKTYVVEANRERVETIDVRKSKNDALS